MLLLVCMSHKIFHLATEGLWYIGYVWVAGSFFCRQAAVDERFSSVASGRIMHEAVGVVQVLTQAALQEFKTGDPERGRGIFEGILRNYPKRMDLWNVYIDQASPDPLQ